MIQSLDRISPMNIYHLGRTHTFFHSLMKKESDNNTDDDDNDDGFFSSGGLHLNKAVWTSGRAWAGRVSSVWEGV